MKKIILQGIPYDGKSSYLKGTSLAPSIIRDKFWSESSNTFSENHIDIAKYIDDHGNKRIDDYFDIEKIWGGNFMRVFKKVQQIAAL